MLGPDPHRDQMQNSKNAHPHAKKQCWTPFVFVFFNHLISLHIVLASLTENITRVKHFSMKFIWALTWLCSAGQEEAGFVAEVVKNKRQIPQNHKNRPNVLSGFQVLYPSVIVIRYVMLWPLLWLGPLCCVRQTISHVTPGKVHSWPVQHGNTARGQRGRYTSVQH